MKYARNCQISVLLVLISAWHVGGQQRSPTIRRTLETVSVCQLTSEWKKYDHRIVRIEAVYASGRESNEVYDIGCASGENTAWAEFPATAEKATPQQLLDKLNRLLRSESRARIIAVGEFAGPKKVEIPPNTPPKVADAMRAVNSRYGHQNRWDFLFVFSKIEKVEAVPPSDPWPRLATEKKK